MLADEDLSPVHKYTQTVSIILAAERDRRRRRRWGPINQATPASVFVYFVRLTAGREPTLRSLSLSSVSASASLSATDRPTDRGLWRSAIDRGRSERVARAFATIGSYCHRSAAADGRRWRLRGLTRLTTALVVSGGGSADQVDLRDQTQTLNAPCTPIR